MACRRETTVLGCPVDTCATADIIDWMISAAEAGDRARFVAVVNANKYYLMARDERLRAIITAADLIVPEWAVVWAARQLGGPRLRHSGGLLVAREFPAVAAARGLRPYYLGAHQHVVDRLVEKLRAEHPTLEIAGAHHGYLTSPEIEAAVLSDIERTRPDVLFVAFGSPGQEYWIDANRHRLGVPVSIGVGGSFDVLCGLKPDTPDWARGHGMEWAYRLAQDPRAYWRRYLQTNSWFAWQVLKSKWRRQGADRPHGGQAE